MCGISGYLSADLAPRNAEDDFIRSAIRYRGRDSEGEWSDSRHVRLFHSRLSIIAPESGVQPMCDHSARFTIVFNGEIYNYLELRGDYTRQGARFISSSDTEVILEGFKIKGPAVCEDLNGMFAFAIWDSLERKLFLARDRLGKKPLFWTTLGDRFFFSSTIDAFRGIKAWRDDLQANAISLYRKLGCFPDPLTVYKNAHSLPAGHYAEVMPGGSSPRLCKYWSLKFPQQRIQKFQDAMDQYEEILTDSIRLRLRADVPIALTFSGGVDSGTIAALAHKRLNMQLKCYTIDYHTENDKSEETRIAQSVALKMGLEWNYIHYDYPKDLMTDAANAIRAFDQPCSQMAMAYSQRLYQTISPFAKVVLSGAGSDEIFTGYSGNEDLLRLDQLQMWKQTMARFIRRVAPNKMSGWLSHWFPGPDLFVKSQGDYIRSAVESRDDIDVISTHVETIINEINEAHVSSRIDLLQFMSIKYFGATANYLLPDITGLRAQVEVRSPYLDYRMIEFGASLPGAFKVGSGLDPVSAKFLPKRVYSKYVSDEIAWAPKKGMAMNVRFYENFYSDVKFDQTAAKLFDGIDASNLDSAEFRNSWNRFIDDIKQGNIASTYAGAAMTGLMLGLWICRVPLAR